MRLIATTIILAIEMSMPEAGQPPQMLHAMLQRRRRSGFRRHRTYCRALKCCSQLCQARIRRFDQVPSAARRSFTAQDGYSFPDSQSRPFERRARLKARERTPRRGLIAQHPRLAPLDTGWQRYLVPQNVAHSLSAPIRRSSPQKSLAAALPRDVAAPRTRNGRRALRALRRFRPMRTKFSAAPPWRR